MTVYHWLVLLLLVFALFLQGNVKGNKKYILIAFILLFFVMGLRDVSTAGSDSSGAHGSYLASYQNIGKTEWGALSGKGDNHHNVGFFYLMKLIYSLTGGNYQSFITILSLFFLFAYLRFIQK